MDANYAPSALTATEMMPVCFLESSEECLNAVSGPETVPFEVVLDSGAAEHVMDGEEAPGYRLEPSEGSKRGVTFKAANGQVIANQGQMVLNLATSVGAPLQSTFQVCSVHRPLWSVGKICDNGCSVTFDAKGATVKSKEGKSVCTFERRNGLYVTTLNLQRPDFARQG